MSAEKILAQKRKGHRVKLVGLNHGLIN